MDVSDNAILWFLCFIRIQIDAEAKSVMILSKWTGLTYTRGYVTRRFDLARHSRPNSVKLPQVRMAPMA